MRPKWNETKTLNNQAGVTSQEGAVTDLGELADLTASQMRDALRSRTRSAREIADACLARTDAREADVQAWAFLDPDHVRAQAEACDTARAEASDDAEANDMDRAPLQGLPVGIKDIIATQDLPTENGSPIFAGHRPEHDASVVAMLRAAGAVIMGKTVTTELATLTPAKTRNPLNPAHTPGGSSSGSAAAVACGMVPLALGTQTGGSVIRPASYCGIYGLKPTFGCISRDGVTLQSHTLDTVGVYGRALEDIALIMGVLDAYDPTDPASYPRAMGGAAYQPAIWRKERAPRFAFVKTPAWQQAEHGAQDAINAFVDGLGDACEIIDLPPALEAILDAHRVIQLVENAYHFGELRRRDGDLLSAGLRQRMDDGIAVAAPDYLAACKSRDMMYTALLPLLTQYDGLIALSSTGPAPASLETTGNAIFNGLWTLLGVPVLSLPKLTIGGMPCGVSLIGRRRADAGLIAAGRWLEANAAPVKI